MMNTARKNEIYLDETELTLQKIIDLISVWNSDLDPKSFATVPMFEEIRKKIIKNDSLHFILPAFPAKSANREKTIGPHPDLGELLALQNLQNICEKIQEIYEPGASVAICSDGRVFNDLVGVNEDDLQIYTNGIHRIIQEMNFNLLSTFSLDDYYITNDFDKMRTHLEDQFAEDIQEIRLRVRSDKAANHLFNGIHRFIKEDLSVNQSSLSKNQLMKSAKAVTYKMLQRSGSWDRLLKIVFPDSLRLSIHPYPIRYHKFGVQLVKGESRWATPWHNVPLLQNNSVRLVSHRDAKQRGAKLNFSKGKYAYYEI